MHTYLRTCRFVYGTGVIGTIPRSRPAGAHIGGKGDDKKGTKEEADNIDRMRV